MRPSLVEVALAASIVLTGFFMLALYLIMYLAPKMLKAIKESLDNDKRPW